MSISRWSSSTTSKPSSRNQAITWFTTSRFAHTIHAGVMQVVTDREGRLNESEIEREVGGVRQRERGRERERGGRERGKRERERGGVGRGREGGGGEGEIRANVQIWETQRLDFFVLACSYTVLTRGVQTTSEEKAVQPICWSPQPRKPQAGILLSTTCSC